ncbi:MAG: TOTE conflict system archaeo-eukaryotic primase domain-containing protein [Ktedonobacteraceae bacterium]
METNMDAELIENLWQCIGRRDTFAVQTSRGGYARINRALRLADLADHLAGRVTIGTYLIDQVGRCAFAVLDADQENGLAVLASVGRELASEGATLHLERSRRGGHGWLFFEQAVPADRVRAWLAPIAARHGLELYPKQAAGAGVGSLIRLPLGVHRKSGRRYPFLGADLQPVGRRASDVLAWLPTAARSGCPVVPVAADRQFPGNIPDAPGRQDKSFSKTAGTPYPSIRAWNAAHDPFSVIGRYVALDRQGVGCCPFGEHHSGGHDTHASFQVYQPHQAGGYCWLCHAGQCGGSLFDFLRLCHGLDARDAWRRIQRGEL